MEGPGERTRQNSNILVPFQVALLIRNALFEILQKDEYSKDEPIRNCLLAIEKHQNIDQPVSKSVSTRFRAQKFKFFSEQNSSMEPHLAKVPLGVVQFHMLTSTVFDAAVFT